MQCGVLLARTGVLRGIGSMAAMTNIFRGNQDVGSAVSGKVSIVDVKQTSASPKKDSGEEDILVMDTKLKIIEILQVLTRHFSYKGDLVERRGGIGRIVRSVSF